MFYKLSLHLSEHIVIWQLQWFTLPVWDIPVTMNNVCFWAPLIMWTSSFVALIDSLLKQTWSLAAPALVLLCLLEKMLMEKNCNSLKLFSDSLFWDLSQQRYNNQPPPNDWTLHA